ncbi:MAG: N-acetyltransferase [Nocardioides sp.]|nr:N-acetyltransferase [Nocardioides sp.]
MGRLTRPVLSTERLRLEPLTDEHTELLVELDSDPEVMRFLLGRASTREESLAWMPRRARPEADARGIGYWVGHDAAGSFLGWWCLAVDDDDPDTAELGYRLSRAAWGHGYATEGSRALLSHAFETLALPSVWAETMVVNTGSRAVMEKLGLRHVLTEVRSWDAPLPGWEQGEVRYVIDLAGWRARYQDV